MYYYQCERDGPYLKQRPKGCMSHDKRRQVPIGGTDDFGDYTYECRQKYDGTIQMCSVGCIHKGKHYKIGEQWPVRIRSASFSGKLLSRLLSFYLENPILLRAPLSVVRNANFPFLNLFCL
ncbi:unnamed protein product [Nippostrongylus brasiliensis]|uniref:Sushi domain-containing protein n=1 Tax=Nippostrongylus brasiliensis TaxID=27835 RepID=A0A0N4Y3K7_NIPBR|nr:unnamed protein product [Nippostrongylus brasiliensis]